MSLVSLVTAGGQGAHSPLPRPGLFPLGGLCPALSLRQPNGAPDPKTLFTLTVQGPPAPDPLQLAGAVMSATLGKLLISI